MNVEFNPEGGISSRKRDEVNAALREIGLSESVEPSARPSHTKTTGDG